MNHAICFHKQKYTVMPFPEVLEPTIKIKAMVDSATTPEDEGIGRILQEEVIDCELRLAEVGPYKVPFYIAKDADTPPQDALLAAAFDWYSWAQFERNYNAIMQQSAEEKPLVQPAKVIPLGARVPGASQR